MNAEEEVKANYESNVNVNLLIDRLALNADKTTVIAILDRDLNYRHNMFTDIEKHEVMELFITRLDATNNASDAITFAMKYARFDIRTKNIVSNDFRTALSNHMSRIKQLTGVETIITETSTSLLPTITNLKTPEETYEYVELKVQEERSGARDAIEYRFGEKGEKRKVCGKVLPNGRKCGGTEFHLDNIDVDNPIWTAASGRVRINTNVSVCNKCGGHIRNSPIFSDVGRCTNKFAEVLKVYLDNYHASLRFRNNMLVHLGDTVRQVDPEEIAKNFIMGRKWCFDRHDLDSLSRIIINTVAQRTP